MLPKSRDISPGMRKSIRAKTMQPYIFPLQSALAVELMVVMLNFSFIFLPAQLTTFTFFPFAMTTCLYNSVKDVCKFTFILYHLPTNDHL